MMIMKQVKTWSAHQKVLISATASACESDSPTFSPKDLAQIRHISQPSLANRIRFRYTPRANAGGAVKTGWYMAEREGFEPSIRCRIHTFQACAFDHSATSPWARSLAQPYPLDEQATRQKEVPSSILK